ncbi:MAG: FHA domain-containing protein [Sphaerospermopsis sp. SIO1G2]|nr:FHA domain-containing protein [Sphaerospermopsis sp. SIO1G2]
MFGEMALFEPHSTRSASARALEHTVVDVMSADELNTLLEESPPLLKPFVTALVDRLREMNRRLAEKERATIILTNNINNLYCHPLGALEAVIAPFSLNVADLPYLIGGYDATEPAPKRMHLEIPCDVSHMNVSYAHCSIEYHDDGIYLVDHGSRFKTMVNGELIGRGESSIKALLLPGENSVTLGDPSYDMRLAIQCE